MNDVGLDGVVSEEENLGVGGGGLEASDSASRTPMTSQNVPPIAHSLMSSDFTITGEEIMKRFDALSAELVETRRALAQLQQQQQAPPQVQGVQQPQVPPQRKRCTYCRLDITNSQQLSKDKRRSCANCKSREGRSLSVHEIALMLGRPFVEVEPLVTENLLTDIRFLTFLAHSYTCIKEGCTNRTVRGYAGTREGAHFPDFDRRCNAHSACRNENCGKLARPGHGICASCGYKKVATNVRLPVKSIPTVTEELKAINIYKAAKIDGQKGNDVYATFLAEFFPTLFEKKKAEEEEAQKSKAAKYQHLRLIM